MLAEMRFWMALACCLCLSFIQACGSRVEERQLEYPLQRLEYLGASEHITLFAAQGVSINSLVTLQSFDHLSPGVSLTEAREILGEPLRTYREWNRDEVYVFQAPDGDIELVRQASGSEGQPIERWFLRLKPNEKPFHTHLSSTIMKIIHDRPLVSAYSVIADDGHVRIEIERGAIKCLWWLRRGDVSGAAGLSSMALTPPIG
jgi:hypothetical protein